MNAGVPRGVKDRETLGIKTTILTVGKLDLLKKALKHARPLHLWHMKLTASGDREWPEICRLAGKRTYVFRYPEDQNDRVHEKVGSSPSTGIRVLDLLQQWSAPQLISVFGCNWFGAMPGDARSWWDMSKRVDASHNGRNEMLCFRLMGFAERRPGVWELRPYRRKPLKV